MATTAGRWLPDSTVKSRRARETIAACTAKWSDGWIAKGKIEAASDWRGAHQNVGFIEAGRKDGVGLKFRPDRDRRLVGMLLGRDMSAKDVRTEQDIQLIDHLVEQAMADLLDALCKAFPPEASGKHAEMPGEDFVELALMPDRKTELIIVSVDRANLTEFALKHSRPPRERSAPAVRETALLDQPIQVSALVGSAKLELAELIEIDIGDVFVLDRPVGKPLDLMINGRTRGVDSASLSLENDHLTLSIERTASQW